MDPTRALNAVAARALSRVAARDAPDEEEMTRRRDDRWNPGRLSVAEGGKTGFFV